jgi:predicted GH43/DUF377 family glycosyl hydrolase
MPEARFRRPLTLSPPTARPDVVLLIVLNTRALGRPYGHINPDGSDLRLTGPDGKTALGYWIEHWDPRGDSRIWVRVPAQGTDRLWLYYGSAQARAASDGAAVFDFFDDFNDGLWTKHPGNPVLTSTEPWEARAICEPSVIVEDGRWRMWYMGCKTSIGTNAALGCATSPDGLAWTKHPGNPILRDPEQAVIRTTVLKHRGTYYLFASDHQWTENSGVINRWTSQDGLRWSNKITVLRPTEPWEKHFHNVGVIVEDDGTWQMLYTTDGPFGYARSRDGVHWTKHTQPVIQGFYGGDPYLAKIAGTYHTWCSRAHRGHLRIYCLTSPDMIHWHGVEHRPQLGYSQPWERGIGRPEVSWDRHLADADLVEHRGQVFMYYGGAQSPFGVTVFDGTMADLAARLRQPLSKWSPSHYGCVEGRQLKVSDNETDAEPLRPLTPKLSDREEYVFEYCVRCEAGYHQNPAATQPEGWSTPTRCVPTASHRATAVIRYGDAKNFARLWAKDNDTTYYEECLDGVWQAPVKLGANRVCDDRWHRWRIEVVGPENRLSIDGRRIGTCRASASLCNRSDLGVGLSTYDTFVAWEDVRVQRGRLAEQAVPVGEEEPAGR